MRLVQERELEQGGKIGGIPVAVHVGFGKAAGSAEKQPPDGPLSLDPQNDVELGAERTGER